MNASLQHALERLYGLERRKDKLGLEGTRALLAAIGNPQRQFHSVHVAGTNGKGSTCARIERVLREAGHVTGLFTSPHLVDFRERIRVRGRWADETRLSERLDWIQSLPAGRDRTFFEVCTALAFDDFAAREVGIAVVEVGLGGRLDCTNLIEPEVCAITSIGLDHTEILGDTIEAIAFEKAGIAKPGVPLVLAAGLDPRARAVIEEQAARVGAPVISATEAGAGEAGGYPGANLATASAVLDALVARGITVPAEARHTGFARARWPGRFENAPSCPRLWWDGAHNPQGAAALVAAWREAGLPAPDAIVLALSRDKDVTAMLDALEPLLSRAHLIATRSHSERALDPDVLVAAATARGLNAARAADIATALASALARPGSAPVLLTGSLFAVGEAMTIHGGAPGEWQ